MYCRLDFTLGHTIYNFAKGFLDYNWQGDNNMTKDVVNRSWKEQGDKADMPDSIGMVIVDSRMLSEVALCIMNQEIF